MWLLADNFFIELDNSFPTPKDSPFNKKFGVMILVGRPTENSLFIVSSFMFVIMEDSLWPLEMVGDTSSDLFLRVPKAEHSKKEFLGVCRLVALFITPFEHNSNLSLLSNFAFEVLATFSTVFLNVSANSAEFSDCEFLM